MSDTLSPPAPPRARALTISQKRGPRPIPANYPLDVVRPATRADCEGGQRPCPWISCRHNLYLDVHPVTGGLKLNFPDLEPGQMEVSCSLDVADRGNRTLEHVADLMNLTRERVRQIEFTPMARMRRLLKAWRQVDWTKPPERRTPRLCEQCGATYTPNADAQRFCPGGVCTAKWHESKRRAAADAAVDRARAGSGR